MLWFFTFLAVKYMHLPVLDNVIIFEKQLLLEKSEKRKSPKFGPTIFFFFSAKQQVKVGVAHHQKGKIIEPQLNEQNKFTFLTFLGRFSRKRPYGEKVTFWFLARNDPYKLSDMTSYQPKSAKMTPRGQDFAWKYARYAIFRCFQSGKL